MSGFKFKWVMLIAMTALLAGLFRPDGAQAVSIESDNRIVDRAGREIRIITPYTRIISLYGAHTENLYSLGLDKQIIGVSRHESYPPAALAKPVFSYHDGPEKYLAANPDLVLIRPMIDRGYPNLVRQLEAGGITVVSLQPATVTDMFVYWNILGRLTGRKAQAAEMIAQFEQAVETARQLTAAIAKRKQVYFEAIHSKMKTFTPGSMAIYALETAGGINIAADATAVRQTNIAYYGKEQILSKAAEIDVYLAQSGSMNRASVAMIKNEPGYQVIKAIRQNQIYIIDETIVSRPTLRLLNGIYEIGSRLYPETFTPEVLGALIIK